jgi:ribonuclease E
VPVDVATFLLNEKRTEFQSMEARLKVSILLIPNIHLETPHARRDDSREPGDTRGSREQKESQPASRGESQKPREAPAAP